MQVLKGGRGDRAHICLVSDEAEGLQRAAPRFHGFLSSSATFSFLPPFLPFVGPQQRQYECESTRLTKKE